MPASAETQGSGKMSGAKWLAAVVGSLLLAAGAWGAETADERFLAGLRDRRLFELAQTYCREKLAQPKLPPVEQATFTTQWMRTIAEQAAHVPADQRAPLWEQIDQLAIKFSTQYPGHPRLLVVRVQGALARVSAGELLRYEVAINNLDAATAQTARDTLRDAAARLTALDQELKKLIPLRYRQEEARPAADKGSASGELSADGLTGLQIQVQEQWARTLQNQAWLAQAAGPTEPHLFLTQASDVLQKLQAQLPTEDSRQNSVLLRLARCWLGLQEWERAATALLELDQPQRPPLVRLEARAEQIRLTLAQKLAPRAQVLTQAQKILDQGRELEGAISTELDLAAVELGLAHYLFAVATKDTPAAEKWLAQATQGVALLERIHGPYWGRRGGQLLVASLPAGASQANPTILQTLAETAYRRKEFDAAIAHYQRGGEDAQKAGEPQRMFDLVYKAGLIEQELRRHTAAGARFRGLAIQQSKLPLAAEAHLLAAWNYAQAAKTDPRQVPLYEEVLREHLSQWPKAKTLSQAQLWLGKLAESRQDWPAACEAYQAIEPTSEHFAPAVAGVARCAPAWLAQLRKTAPSAVKPVDPLVAKQTAEKLAQFFQDVVLGPEQRVPLTWTFTQRLAATSAAAILLDEFPDQTAEAEQILTAALASVADDKADQALATWLAEARSLLVVALAAQPGKRAEAAQVLASLEASSPAALLQVTQRLGQVTQRTRASLRGELAKLQLQTLDLIDRRRSELSASQQLQVIQQRAEALALTGNRKDALAIYARLAKENPANSDIQEGYGELLLVGPDKESLTAALTQWRVVVSRCKPHSLRWLQAKYSVALAQVKLGEKQPAATLLRYLLETPPGLENSPLKTQFVELLRQAEQ